MNRQQVTGEQLTLVFNVLLDGYYSDPVLAQPRKGQSHRRQKLPGGFIKLSHVPHHVHVPHLVAMPGIHCAAIGKDGFSHTLVRSLPLGAAVGMSSPKSSCSEPVKFHSRGKRESR